MEEFIALRDCVITGHRGIVRSGDRIQLSPRAAKYPRIKGWIAPAPAPDKPAADASADPAPAPKDPPPRRRRQPRR